MREKCVSEIRNCAREDIPAVAALFCRTFLKSKRLPPASLETHLADVYLSHPWYDPDVAARVHVNGEGRVTGFIGVFPGRFEFRGASFRAAIAGTLMAEDPEADPLAGARLLRSVIKGRQDISISETTNPLSQGLWERLGGTVVPLLSLDWLRVFRPGGAALSLLTERMPGAVLLAPAAWAGDWLGRRWANGALLPAAPSSRLIRQADPPEADFVAAVRELAFRAELHPSWGSGEDVRWLLGHATRKERYGSVRRTIVRDAKGALAGCYIYHGKPGGTGRVLQVLARADAVEDVVDCLLYEADEAGLSALRGRLSPQLADALLTRNCVFAHRASTMIHTANDDLAGAVKRGEAMITGLAGESWSRLIGGAFA